MDEGLRWFAMASGIIAAVIVSSNVGARYTAGGFMIFFVSSLAWVTAGLLEGDPPLTIQNGVLAVINVFGVFRWLGR